MAPAMSRDALGVSGGTISALKDNFHRLVDDLSRILGPSSGLNSDDVDVKHLEQLMLDYVSKESDWQKYAFADMTRGYTRNLVDEGNGKSNLVRYNCTSRHSLQLYFPRHLGFSVLRRLTASVFPACPCMDAWQRLPHPRSCRRTLPHESPQRHTPRNSLLLSRS